MTIEASSLRILCVEIYKTINSINEIFRLRITNRTVHSQYRLIL